MAAVSNQINYISKPLDARGVSIQLWVRTVMLKSLVGAGHTEGRSPSEVAAEIAAAAFAALAAAYAAFADAATAGCCYSCC